MSERIIRSGGLVDYVIDLSGEYIVPEEPYRPATQVRRWFNRDASAWVVYFADADGGQVGHSEYIGSGGQDAKDFAWTLVGEANVDFVRRALAAGDSADWD